MNHILTKVYVDNIEYEYIWWDCTANWNFELYKDGKPIGSRDLPIGIEKSDLTVQYLIRRMVGKYGPIRNVHAKREESSYGNR